MKPRPSSAKRPAPTPDTRESDAQGVVFLPSMLTVKQLAGLLQVSAIEVIKDLMRNGVMASINQAIDYDSAAIVAADFGYEPKGEPSKLAGTVPELGRAQDEAASQKPRPPVVTIMGHVDHGKTSLLDAIRQTNVIATEVGGITQHIGAYQVEVHDQKITFLDTPGHEAFTAMRARGAMVTDIAILVVAADEGAMPQTLEAIDHARAAGVPVVVAINKIDKPTANPERVKQQLADAGLIIEEWGGDVVSVSVSAKKGQGISELLENLLIVAELQELKANPDRRAIGAVIEARLDTTKGPLATVLVQTGTLKVGDHFVVGDTWGKVKAMFDYSGKRVKTAGPAMPVEVLGLNQIAHAGDTLEVVATEREARALAQQRQKERQQQVKATRALTLDSLSTQIRAGEARDLSLILKTDAQGSIEPIRNSLERLSTEAVKVRIIHSGSGTITESDVMLAIASRGIIIGFNTHPEPGAKRVADSERVDIRTYKVIYNLVEDIERALKGLLEPSYIEVIEGHAEVRVLFDVRERKVAGVYVTDGRVSRGALARVLRHGQSIYESEVFSLKHFKEHVREMAAGFECGVGITGFPDFEVGDIIEVYRREKK